MSLSCLHKTTLEKIALNSIGSIDNSIKNENLLRFDSLFKIISSIVSKNIDALKSNQATSTDQTNIFTLKNFLIRVIELLCKLCSEFEIWDIYTLHLQFGRFLEYCIDLDYIFALLHLTTKLMTLNESGDPHYFDTAKNMGDIFTFLMPVFGLLESFNNNLDQIYFKMSISNNMSEMFFAALKFTAPESKYQVDEFLSNITGVRKDMKDTDFGTVAELLASSLPIFSNEAFLKNFPDTRRQKYFILGAIALFLVLTDPKLFDYGRNALLYSALVIKSTFFSIICA